MTAARPPRGKDASLRKKLKEEDPKKRRGLCEANSFVGTHLSFSGVQKLGT